MAQEPTRDTSEDPRLEEVQEDVDEIRARIPKNPGLDVPDPDVQPVVPAEENVDGT